MPSEPVTMLERNAAWFEDLYEKHVRQVYRYLWRRVSPNDVDDLTADVFATAWRRRDEIPDAAELPWLYRTAAFTMANYRRKRQPTPLDKLPESEANYDIELAHVADVQARAALASLSSRDRQILLLHAWDGLTAVQLAAVFGISRSGADAALSRARARLRECWDV